MARFSSIDVVGLRMNSLEAVNFVRSVLQKRYVEFVDEDAISFCCRQGTQWGTRILGGWFVPPDWLPKQVTVAVESMADHSKIYLSTEEMLGFGLFGKRLCKRYDLFVQSLLAEIRLMAGDKYLAVQPPDGSDLGEASEADKRGNK
ncbi:MAG: hypothetical protein ACYS9X_23670 [Planctomycetota bacterium]|jgi:hypothetical protein